MFDHDVVEFKFRGRSNSSLHVQVEYNLYQGLHRGKSFPMEAQGLYGTLPAALSNPPIRHYKDMDDSATTQNNANHSNQIFPMGTESVPVIHGLLTKLPIPRHNEQTF